MRTEQEVVQFLDSKVGTRIPDKLNPNLNGQCVTEIKALLEFLGVPNPYAPRGHAKDYATNLVKQGIATNGRGRINVIVNPDMGVSNGVTYGHIWAEINGQNWESNGAKPLTVTKNTRPTSQGRQFVNLDKWITQGVDMINRDQVKDLYRVFLGREAGDNEAQGWVGPWDRAFYGIKDSPEGQAYRAKQAAERAVAEANKTDLAAAKAALVAANKALAEAQAKSTEDTELLNTGGTFLKKLFKRLFGGN